MPLNLGKFTRVHLPLKRFTLKTFKNGKFLYLRESLKIALKFALRIWPQTFKEIYKVLWSKVRFTTYYIILSQIQPLFHFHTNNCTSETIIVSIKDFTNCTNIIQHSNIINCPPKGFKSTSNIDLQTLSINLAIIWSIYQPRYVILIFKKPIVIA